MNDRGEENNRGLQSQGAPSEREVLHLFAAACDEVLTDEEAARLTDLLEHYPAVQQRYIEYIHLDTNLRYELAGTSAPDSTPGMATGAGFDLDLPLLPGERASAAPLQAPVQPPSDAVGGLLNSLFGSAGSWLPAVCRSTAFGMMACAFLGAAAAALVVSQLARQREVAHGQLPRIEVPRNGKSLDEDSYVATLVNATNCRWDKSRSTIDFQGRGGLKPGQSLHLLEGVALVNSKLPSGAVAEFQLEGPLALVLTSEGMPTLQFGRLMASLRSDYDRFTLDLPFGGRVTVSGDASIGIVAAANDIELHVFSGMAMFEYMSNGLEPFPEQIKTAAGTSIRARVAVDGSLAIEHGKARANRFATATDIAESRLAISDAYVKAIRDAKPLGYWRFESEEAGIVRNEMADRLHCRIVGEAVRLSSGPGNRSAEFGSTDGPGYLYSDDEIAHVGDSYAAEAWVKPSYYHHATLFSLVDPKDASLQQHRFLLELCGPGPGQPTVRPWEAHPNQVRFFHRGVNRGGPSQCYSPTAYALRKWQHVVIVKENANMRLYVDGDRVAEAKDRHALGERLHVQLGQLYPKDAQGRDVMQARQFVGQLDEVAFYDRVLTEAEIRAHFHAARPAVESAGPDS